MINPHPTNQLKPSLHLVDTHCHIHFDDYGLPPDEVLKAARAVGVTKVICVGTTLHDSQAAVDFAAQREGVYASVGIHPHEASSLTTDKLQKIRNLLEANQAGTIVAIGEVGLDYHYLHSPKTAQQGHLREFLTLAQEFNLPLIFHVREAFDDFWPIVDAFPGLNGVIHSFSATTKELQQILERDFYIGLNGIMTFTKDQAQLAAAKAVPLDRLVLETDAPYLTPKPNRGKVCTPAHILDTAKFLANLRTESLDQLAQATTQNATKLFGLSL